MGSGWEGIRRDRIRVVTTLALAAALVAQAPPSSVRAEEAVPLETRLAPLRTIGRTGGTIASGPTTTTVVVKFREGEDVRLEESTLVAAKTEEREAVAAIARSAVEGGVRATFERSREWLRDEERRLEARTGRDLADLSLYFDVRVGSPDEAVRLARELEATDAVEFAYARPAPLPPAPLAPLDQSVYGAARGEQTTPDLRYLQFYLSAAPAGFGIEALRDLPGGRGELARIVDIEYSWNLDHEDMPFDGERQPFVAELGTDPFPEDRGNHGTAVLGMLVGAENDYGVTGICPEADIGVMSPIGPANDYRLALTIDRASELLTRDGARGGILQIEQQGRGINNEIAALPPEWDPAVFDAIQRAVARGVVVVEPAGNGGLAPRGDGTFEQRGVDLDRPELGGAFNRKKRDSGAIIVGGGFPADAARVPTSNYGSRVDVQGYGLFVCTTGYGDLFTKGVPETAYTNAFGGTSSAVPCVTGVAALVQSTLATAGVAPLDGFLMRALLAGSGTPDGSLSSEPIGPRPNVLLAAEVVADPSVPFITNIKFNKRKDRLIVDGIYFRAPGEEGESGTILLIDGQPVETDYPSGYDGPGETTTRIRASGVKQLIPRKKLTLIQVRTTDGAESPPRYFVRK